MHRVLMYIQLMYLSASSNQSAKQVIQKQGLILKMIHDFRKRRADFSLRCCVSDRSQLP